MLDLSLNRKQTRNHVLKIAQEITSVSDVWLADATRRAGLHEWNCTVRANNFWQTSQKTEAIEAELYKSVDFTFDCIRCFFTDTRSNVNNTVKNILEIRRHVPEFCDGWTFIDYYAGVGLSSILLAQRLEAEGIDARVVYHNSPGSVLQVNLAKAFSVAAGSPKNLDFSITDDIPVGDCYAFFEVFEHIRKPWDFAKSLIEKVNPKAVVHASSFNLPDCAGHFETYEINGSKYTGSRASGAFEKRWRLDAGYTCVDGTDAWNSRPSWAIKNELVAQDLCQHPGRWDLKKRELEIRKSKLIQYKCENFVDELLIRLKNENWDEVRPEAVESLAELINDKHRLRSSGF